MRLAFSKRIVTFPLFILRSSSRDERGVNFQVHSSNRGSKISVYFVDSGCKPPFGMSFAVCNCDGGTKREDVDTWSRFDMNTKKKCHRHAIQREEGRKM